MNIVITFSLKNRSYQFAHYWVTRIKEVSIKDKMSWRNTVLLLRMYQIFLQYFANSKYASSVRLQNLSIVHG